MKQLYLLTIFLFSLNLLSCGDDSVDEPVSIIEDEHTVLRRQLCEAFGLNPSDLDEDAFGACWNDQFLVVCALRTTDSKLVVAAFDSISNRQFINDFSISMPRTITRPYYDQQVEYSLRYVVPRIIRIKDGFVCSIGARYIANQDFFDNTYGYFYNSTNLVCTKLANVSANSTMTAWYENSCLLTDRNQTVCYTTDGEKKGSADIVSQPRTISIEPKNPESEEDLLQHRSDGTDAFNTLYIGYEKFLQHDFMALWWVE